MVADEYPLWDQTSGIFLKESVDCKASLRYNYHTIDIIGHHCIFSYVRNVLYGT